MQAIVSQRRQKNHNVMSMTEPGAAFGANLIKYPSCRFNYTYCGHYQTKISNNTSHVLYCFQASLNPVP